MEIHHIGMVVKDINEHYTKYFGKALKCGELSQIYKDEKIGVNVAFVNLNNKIYLEFVEPLNDKSPVHNFLQKRGQSLHHLCFEVDDIEAECSNMQKESYFVTMSPTPAVAFNGRKVAFLLSKEANYLIELLEKE
jgi:methylmalonyl-CoA/ethylmalonyl-CoA epimerase